MISSAKAGRLRDLHRPGRPVVVPCAWDAASARVMADVGFAAVAAGNTALAHSLGHPLGRRPPIAELLDAVARMVAVVAVPVTVDLRHHLDRGHRARPEELVERLAAAGVAGCTFPDSDPRTGRAVGADLQAEFLAAVREAVARSGLELVIGARIDGAPRPGAPPQHRLDDLVDRARRYLRAGADCVCPLRLHRRHDIAAMVAATGGRLDLHHRSGPGATPSLAELARLGVSRISVGHGLHATYARSLRAMLHRIRAGGDPLAP